MDDLDLGRWRALLDAYRDAQDSSVPFIALQDAQAALSRARADLDQHRSRGPVGHADQHMTPERIAKGFARDIAELEGRVRERERDLRRISARVESTATRRNALHQLVEGVRTWAQSQGIALPGDDTSVFPGYGPAVNVPEPPAGTPSFMSPLPPGRAGDGAPPAARASRGGGIVRLMQGLRP